MNVVKEGLVKLIFTKLFLVVLQADGVIGFTTQADGVIGFSTQANGNRKEPIHECVYYTPVDYLEELKNDPLGEMCQFGSDYVEKTCNLDTSSHQCRPCYDGSMLPSICFCDEKDHCEGKKGDGPNKYNCYKCITYFNLTFPENIKNLNKCTRIQDRLPIRDKDCNEGYTGTLCTSISKRVCELDTDQQGTSCINSNANKCLIQLNGATWSCQNFITSNLKKRHRLVNCTTDVIVTMETTIESSKNSPAKKQNTLAISTSVNNLPWPPLLLLSALLCRYLCAMQVSSLDVTGKHGHSGKTFVKWTQKCSRPGKCLAVPNRGN